jgi:hypothetical protein
MAMQSQDAIQSQLDQLKTFYLKAVAARNITGRIQLAAAISCLSWVLGDDVAAQVKSFLLPEDLAPPPKPAAPVKKA